MRKILALFLSLLSASPAFAGCGTSCYANANVGEEQFYVWNGGRSLLADVVAQAASGSYYADQALPGSSASTSWMIPTGGSGPALATNVDGTTFSAWQFYTGGSQNTTASGGFTPTAVAANWLCGTNCPLWPQTADFTLVIVADVATGTGSNIYALAGSGLTTANGWLFGVKTSSGSMYPYFQVTGAGVTYTGSSALATGVPLAFILAWSSVDKNFNVATCNLATKVCGSFVTTSIASSNQASTPTDATLWLGNVGMTGYYAYNANIFRAMYLTESFANALKSKQLTFLETILKGKY